MNTPNTPKMMFVLVVEDSKAVGPEHINKLVIDALKANGFKSTIGSITKGFLSPPISPMADRTPLW